jgi:hypothetical protein
MSLIYKVSIFPYQSAAAVRSACLRFVMFKVCSTVCTDCTPPLVAHGECKLQFSHVQKETGDCLPQRRKVNL